MPARRDPHGVGGASSEKTRALSSPDTDGRSEDTRYAIPTEYVSASMQHSHHKGEYARPATYVAWIASEGDNLGFEAPPPRYRVDGKCAGSERSDSDIACNNNDAPALERVVWVASSTRREACLAEVRQHAASHIAIKMTHMMRRG